MTSGTIALIGSDSVIHIEGARGMTFDAFNFLLAPTTEVKDLCSGSPEPSACPPGARLSLSNGASGSDLTGVATLDGQSFVTGMGSETQGSALVSFSASMVVPPLTTAQVSVYSPFNFLGFLLPPFGGPGSPESVALIGRGTVRVDLARIAGPFGPVWNYQRAIYRFEDGAAVAEPATLLLVGSGLAAATVRRRSRAA